MYIAKEPILPMRLFRNRNLVGAWLVIFFQGMVFFGFIFYLPIWFQVVEGSTVSCNFLFIFEENNSLIIP